MLRVKTYLDKSNIDGIGLFANENIKKGQILWQYVSNFDKEFSFDEYLKIIENAHPLDKEFLIIRIIPTLNLTKTVIWLQLEIL